VSERDHEALPDSGESEEEDEAAPISPRMRAEVNAYASAILMKLLAIINDIPASHRNRVAGLDLEVRQMLTFIDPSRAAWLEDQPQLPDRPPALAETFPAGAALDGEVISMLERIERLTADRGAAARESFESLRAELARQRAESDERLQALRTQLQSLEAIVAALVARREHAIDLSGVAEERIRTGAWKVALIAGLTAGSLVATVLVLVVLAT
jgi:hypothetical protein